MAVLSWQSVPDAFIVPSYGAITDRIEHRQRVRRTRPLCEQSSTSPRYSTIKSRPEFDEIARPADSLRGRRGACDGAASAVLAGRGDDRVAPGVPSPDHSGTGRRADQ